MLHITNGDSAAETMLAARLPGEVLPWVDILHEGPVLPGLDDRSLAHVRSAFLTSHGYASLDEAERWQKSLLAELERYTEHEEVVLWFEHDLFDQLLLLRHLDWFARQPVAPRKLSLVCIDEYLGMLEPERFTELLPQRRGVTDMDTAFARHAWAAFTAEDPSGVEAVAALPSAPLRFVPAAFRRLLQEYPWTRDGLSRLERQGLEALAAGAKTLVEAFPRSTQAEEAIFLGDLTFFVRMRGWADCPVPLMNLQLAGTPEHIARAPASLTETGRAVLAGRGDAIRLNGIDRWIGGVHLAGADAEWRWDESSGRIVGAV
jgi:hypothetical protein